MPYIVLIPAILCLAVLIQGGTQRAFFNVALPAILLLPTYYFWKVPLLPPIGFLEAALIPLGLGMLFTNMPQWKLTRTDIWMAIFLFSSGYADYQNGLITPSIFDWFRVLSLAVFPYMAGKLLIEQSGARVATSKRFVWILAVVCIPSSVEFILKVNPFVYFWSHFFREWAGQITQLRWGFGRVAGPYGQSESTGIVLFTGLFLTLWLAKWNYWEPRIKRLGALPVKKANAITAIILGSFFLSMARGPWFGGALAWCVAYIGRANNLLRRALVVGCLVLVVGVPGYTATKQYLSGPATSGEQWTAQYRQELLQNYIPIAQMKGAWGWGPAFPRVAGQYSVDNEFLLVYLTQGYVGMVAFFLILLEGAVAFLRTGVRTASPRERQFNFSLLGVLAGFAITLTTVYLGSQPYPLFFLLIGWSQSVRESGQGSYGEEWTGAEVRIAEAETLRVFT